MNDEQVQSRGAEGVHIQKPFKKSKQLIEIRQNKTDQCELWIPSR